MLCTSGFMDDVTFGRRPNGPYGDALPYGVAIPGPCYSAPVAVQSIVINPSPCLFVRLSVRLSACLSVCLLRHRSGV